MQKRKQFCKLCSSIEARGRRPTAFSLTLGCFSSLLKKKAPGQCSTSGSRPRTFRSPTAPRSGALTFPPHITRAYRLPHITRAYRPGSLPTIDRACLAAFAEIQETSNLLPEPIKNCQQPGWTSFSSLWASDNISVSLSFACFFMFSKRCVYLTTIRAVQTPPDQTNATFGVAGRFEPAGAEGTSIASRLLNGPFYKILTEGSL